jgi:hypothetical protein
MIRRQLPFSLCNFAPKLWVLPLLKLTQLLFRRDQLMGRTGTVMGGRADAGAASCIKLGHPAAEFCQVLCKLCLILFAHSRPELLSVRKRRTQ